MTPPASPPSEAFAPLLDSLACGVELSAAQIEGAVAALTDERESDPAKAAFLRALRAKGETPAEIAGFARAMLARAVDPGIDPARMPGPLLDVCGTGGDRLGFFNVSTTAALVLAAGGACVVKHGNRAVTSTSGGADVLAALGVPLDLPPEELRRSLETTGFGFLFAPQYHPAFKAVAPVRRQLAAEGVSTIFNLLGPLLNPARPARQLVGVYSGEVLGTYAEVLRQLNRQSAWAVHGAGGMDELSTLGETRVCRFTAGGKIVEETITPEQAGLARVADLAELRGGSAEDNARTLTGILSGEIGGARRDIVLLNAAAGFVVAGLADNLAAGVERARECHRKRPGGRSLTKDQGTLEAGEDRHAHCGSGGGISVAARREGRCVWQYSSPSAATRNSNSGAVNSVRPHTLQ